MLAMLSKENRREDGASLTPIKFSQNLEIHTEMEKEMTEEAVQVEVIETAVAISLFTPFERQLQELEIFNEGIVFDYKDKKDNEAARSLVYKFRRLKGATDKARKARKNEIDTAGKTLIARIEGLIAVHDVPLKAEKDRVDRIEGLIHRIASTVERATEHNDSADLEGDIVILEEYQIDERFEEFQEQAEKVKTEGVKILGEYLVIAQGREAEKAELERFRKAEQERLAEKARKEREEELPRNPEIQNAIDSQAPPAVSGGMHQVFNSADITPEQKPSPAEPSSMGRSTMFDDFPGISNTSEPSAMPSVKDEIMESLRLLTTSKGIHVVSPLEAIVITEAIIEGKIPHVKVVR